jgi:hypothetical protein
VIPPPDAQLAWFSAALEELPDFLRSADVFRPLHPPPHDKPQDLSLGGVLLAVDAIEAVDDELTQASRKKWETANRNWREVSARHAAAIERKASAELPQRLNLWRAYLQDLEERPRGAGHYAVEVRHRVIIERLMEVLGGGAGSKASQAARSDDLLRPMFRPGSFIWPPELKRVYPERPFWYLYGSAGGTK